MHLIKGSLLIFCISISICTQAEKLRPGFSKAEYKELMLISVRSVGSDSYSSEFEEPAQFKMIYQSKALALDNQWDLWVNANNQAVISLRGTTARPESWLENFYAAMVPAKGQLSLGINRTFDYELASNPQAAVHIGWLVGMAYLSEEILPRIDSLYQQGIKGFYLVGHSQGGAINYLLTAHLLSLQQKGQLPADIQFKTYCSAAPKPGNLYFAYHYEALTQNGWAFNVVNAADWVPEVPMSIQTLNDFNAVNPFKHARGIIKKQKFPARTAMRHVFHKLDKPTRKAQHNYQKYLGEMTSKLVLKQLPDLVVPDFQSTNHYVRTGITIVLQPQADYYQEFVGEPHELFIHHFHKPYLYLLERLNQPFYEQ